MSSQRFNKDIPVLDDSSDYVTWKKEVEVWKLGTSAKNTQWASKLIMNMSGKPRDVSLNIPVNVLGATDGADKLIAELDKIYSKDTTQSLFKAIDQFESYRRAPSEDIDKYILEFQRKYKSLKQLQEDKDLYGDAILAYRLLNQANLSEEQQRLVRATCTTSLTFQKMKEQLKRTFGDALGERSSLPFKNSQEEIKQEPIFYTSSRGGYEDHGHYENDHNSGEGRVYWSGDYNRTRNSNSNYRPNRAYHHNNNRYNPYAPKNRKFDQRPHQQRGSKRPYPQRGTEETKTSPRRSPDKRNCFICHEPGHYCSDCPYNIFPKAEQMQSPETKLDRNVYAVFDNELPLPPDSIHALLDTGSCRTVCGNKWLIQYLESLPQEERDCIYFERYDQEVCFGDRDFVTSKLRTALPVTLCGEKTVIRVYIVPREIPLLLAMDNMKRLKIVIDFTNSRISIGGRHQDMVQTESGHSLVSLSGNTEPLEETTLSTLKDEHESGSSNEETAVRVSGERTKKRKKRRKKKKKKNTADKPDENTSRPVMNQAPATPDARTTTPISHQMDRGVT